jgi:beta-lactamase class D
MANRELSNQRYIQNSTFKILTSLGDVAQWLERLFVEQDVAGSIPVFPA